MPIDPGRFRIDRLSRSDLVSQLLAEIMRQKERAAEDLRRAPPPRRRSGGLLLGVLGALFLGLSAWNLVRRDPNPEPFTPEQQDASLRLQVYLAVQALEVYRDSAGVYPPTLATVDADQASLIYLPSGSSYTIVAAAGPVHLTYHEGDDLVRLMDGFEVLTGHGGAGPVLTP
jgi:hypothetical protein